MTYYVYIISSLLLMFFVFYLKVIESENGAVHCSFISRIIRDSSIIHGTCCVNECVVPGVSAWDHDTRGVPKALSLSGVHLWACTG